METRFASLDANEIDDLAKLKHEKNTVRQTKWAVKLFKGKNYFHQNIKLSIAKTSF